jgi:hypothetical protein
MSAEYLFSSRAESTVADDATSGEAGRSCHHPGSKLGVGSTGASILSGSSALACLSSSKGKFLEKSGSPCASWRGFPRLSGPVWCGIAPPKISRNCPIWPSLMQPSVSKGLAQPLSPAKPSLDQHGYLAIRSLIGPYLPVPPLQIATRQTSRQPAFWFLFRMATDSAMDGASCCQCRLCPGNTQMHPV